MKIDSISINTKIGIVNIYLIKNYISSIDLSINQKIIISRPKVNSLLINAKKQILEYLNQKRKFFDLKFNLEGTSFQKSVLLAIKEIPYGQTKSYKEIATICGRPNAFRAVGNICKNNKIPILIPCHRVIKSNGSIGNYNSGTVNKKMLLAIENLKLLI